MTAGLDLVKQRLEERGCGPVKRDGKGWKALCPAHDDTTPSLSIAANKRDYVTVHCRAGCDWRDVFGALGLTVADVWPSEDHDLGEHGVDHGQTDPADWEFVVEKAGGGRKAKPAAKPMTEVERYRYEDADGNLSYYIVRYAPKTFRPLQPDGTWQLREEQRILYRQQEVLAAVALGEVVYIPEGERDVDSIEKAGGCATTNPGGAGKWLAQYNGSLEGAIVVIIADRDRPGAKHVIDVAEHLRPVARSVRIVRAATGKDATDHLDAGYGLDDFIPVTDDDLQAMAEPVKVETHDELPAIAPNLPAEFWEEREAFAHIRQAAHARLLAADSLLHAVLARVAAFTPHTIELPAVVGSAGSLNYFAALVGPPGSGKSQAMRAATELVAVPDGLDIREQPLGSGEGIAEAYMGSEEIDGKQVRAQVRRHALITADEGEALARLADRQGATLAETLRRGWTGDLLGQANASAENRRVIPARNYRLAMIIGFQPERAGWLLGDAAGGTPQRFTWAAATDPTITDDAPVWPGPLKWEQLDDLGGLDGAGDGRHHLGIDDEISAEVRSHRVATMQGRVAPDPLDGHAYLARLKLAALLALLERRNRIDLDDWRLSGIIWRTSTSVRTWIRDTCAAEVEADEAAKVERYARRERAGAAARDGAAAAVARIAHRTARYVHDHPEGQPYTRGALHRRLSSAYRPLVDDALGYAITERWLVDGPDGFSIGAVLP